MQANGTILKGSYANDKRNGIALKWLPSGSLYQGTYKDGKADGLQIIHYKASGKTADADYQNNLFEGLYAEHTSDGIFWCTHSNHEEHGLKIKQNNDIILMEADKIRKRFN